MNGEILKWRWNLHRFLIGIQLVLAPVIGIAVIFARNWMTLLPSRVCNVSLDALMMIILFVLFLISIRDCTDRTFRTGCFPFLICINSMALLADLVAWCVDGIPSLIAVNMAINTLLYGLGIYLTILSWQYMMEMSGLESKNLKILTKVLNAGAIVFLALLIGNLFGRYYFTVNADGFYQRMPLHPLCYAFMLLMIVCTLLLTLRQDVSRDKKIAFLSFIAGPVATAIFQMTLYGNAVIYIGSACSLLLVYGNVFSRQNRELIEKKLEVSEKEREILTARQEHQRIEAELSLAADIQTHSIPSGFPRQEGFSLYAQMIPARQVGGDFYDFFFVDEAHLALIIADVSGKGIPAALYMMTAKTMLKLAADQGLSPAGILQLVNHKLNAEEENVTMFVTAWVGIVDLNTGVMTAANAGHEYPIIRQGTGEFSLYKEPHGLVLGAMDGMYYQEYSLKLEPGDTLVVYTDGVTEAVNDDMHMFGTDKLLASLNEADSDNPRTLLTKLMEDIHLFAGETEQSDDITMMAFTMGKPEGKKDD